MGTSRFSLAFLAVALLATGCSKASSSSVGSPNEEGGQPAAKSAFDKLDPADIPFAKRTANQPKELVAVLGSSGNPAGYYVAMSRDGRWLAVSDVKATMRVYDTSTWKEAGVAKGFVPAFSPDSKTLVAGDAEGQLHFWDISGGQLKKQTSIGAHADEVWALAFSPDGKLLASGSREAKKVRIWDVAGKEPTAKETLEDHKGSITLLGFSPDGKLFASGAAGTDIRIYEVKDGKFKGKAVIENKNGGGSMMFSPDGKTLAAPTAGKTGVLWDVSGDQPKQTATLEGYGQRMNSLTFSPDGKRLVSGGQENRVAVWDTSGKKLIEWTVPAGAAASAYVGDTLFAPDGRHVVTANGDGSVWILRLP